MASCRSTKNIPAGAPPEMRLREFISAAQIAENDFENLRIKFSATYKSEGNSQDFRMEARLLKDSAVWIDIADPFLGIKVARAIVFKDSVAFVNRMENSYLKGTVEEMKKEFNIDFGFEDLQQILSANLIFDLTREFELYYRPGLYLLSDFDPEGSDPAAFAGKEVFRQVSFNPEVLKPTLQVQNEPAMGRRYSVSMSEFIPRDGGIMYPSEIRINFLDQTEGDLKLDVRGVEKNVPGLNLPFNIPASYEQMQ